MREYLSAHRVGVLCVPGGKEVSAIPVRYRSRDLELDCLVPRWADAAYNLGQTAEVLLVVPILGLVAESPLSWLQYRGVACPAEAPDWRQLLPEGASTAQASDLYVVAHVMPQRIDLVDERLNWGVCETVEV